LDIDEGVSRYFDSIGYCPDCACGTVLEKIPSNLLTTADGNCGALAIRSVEIGKGIAVNGPRIRRVVPVASVSSGVKPIGPSVCGTHDDRVVWITEVEICEVNTVDPDAPPRVNMGTVLHIELDGRVSSSLSIPNDIGTSVCPNGDTIVWSDDVIGNHSSARLDEDEGSRRSVPNLFGHGRWRVCAMDDDILTCGCRTTSPLGVLRRRRIACLTKGEREIASMMKGVGKRRSAKYQTQKRKGRDTKNYSTNHGHSRQKLERRISV